MDHTDTLASILERTRQNLLDLSLRNRLINTPRGVERSRRLDIVDEKSAEVFRLLVRESKSMSFVASPTADAKPESNDESQQDSLEFAAPGPSPVLLNQPGEESDGASSARYRDNQLQTGLASAKLQQRLMDLYYDARTFEEEQGVSILYLALGFVEWYEDDSSDKPRYAPLILIPVELSRASASSRFKLRFREADLETNLSLQAKFRIEFGIELPDVVEGDDFEPTDYFAKVETAITGQPRWKVQRDDMVLWFFSFAKYLMYRDLDPTTWPEHSPLNNNQSLRRLLIEGFPPSPPLCDDDDPIDPIVTPQHAIHVTDADSSQAIVIEEVRRGGSLVVQGPPGTGKSQTITNLIATAVQSGQKVLFVAEKMAALEVVKSRLDRVGLGSMCLELHSHKSNKRDTLEELNRTLELRRPRMSNQPEVLSRLTDARDRLNRHANLMNTPVAPSEVTPFQMLGKLVAFASNGTTAIPIELDHPTGWTRSEFETRRHRLEDLESYVREMGDVVKHAWRGVGRMAPVLPSDLQTLTERIRRLPGLIEPLIRDANELCLALGIETPDHHSSMAIGRLTELGNQTGHRPKIDLDAIVDPVWDVYPAKIQQLVEQGLTLTDCKSFLAGKVSDIAWSTDMAEARRSLAAHGRCICWFLYPSYWRAVAVLRGIAQGDVPARLDDKLELIDRLMTAQTARKQVAESSEAIGARAFGSMWSDESSDFAALKAIVDWEQQGREALYDVSFRSVTSRLRETKTILEQTARLREKLAAFEKEWRALFDHLQLDSQAAFGVTEFRLIPLSDVASRCGEWNANAESLSKWIGYRVRCAAINQDRLSPLIQKFECGTIQGNEFVSRFEQAYYESLLKDLLAREPELAAFDGSSHEQSIRRFRELDLERMAVARSEVALTHYSSIPRTSQLGEMAIVRGEIAKKRMHRPIRQLLREAGQAVQAIKPVFMMSPISVAQFLEPGVLEFDLLVMDEASQVTPEDALGAIARAKQLVVVGDSRQLPPSRFFSRLLDSSESNDHIDMDAASNLDSVLGLCVSRGLSQRMLRWHYRSRHHSLIAVSNKEFYDDRLCVVPSPAGVSEGSGLKFRFVADGRFDRGATATNRREAAVIADAAIEHARQRPTSSLGIASFSVAQRDAIRDELELRLRQNPDLDEFFSTSRPESFFVKNLENVQGDERDFIFISVGYAPDVTGNFAMNFGPLGTDGGERRLNVLISRAKECCVVFSSIHADQIDLNRARSKGAASLKIFLKYAESGELDSHQAAEDSQRDDFERQVSKALAAVGKNVASRVGTNGFGIDLAIVDPEQPDRYTLGIECDGPTYHTSRWARDRDRLRETILTDRGWRLHRVWSCDWFHRPEEELRKVVAAIENALRPPEPELAEPTTEPDAADDVPQDIDREDGPELTPIDGVESPAYIEAAFDVPVDKSIPDVATAVLSEIATKVVTIESPVHRSEVARRILTLWGQQRLGPAIARAIDAAIDECLESKAIEQDLDQFLSIAGTEIPIRSRRDVKSETLRKPELIPPTEIRAAIRKLAADHVGISRDQLASAIAKLLGLKLVTPKCRSSIDDQLTKMIEQQEIKERDEQLYL